MNSKMNSPQGLNNSKSIEYAINRRDMLRATGAGVLAASAFPLHWAAAVEKKKQKVLYFSRSAGFEHDAVKLKDGKPSISDRILTELGKRHGFEVVCTKDGRVFDGDIDQYDAIAFYTSGDLTKPNKAKTPPMSPEGKKKLLRTIADGKGFVGLHAATDSFHSEGPKDQNQTEVDPYIAMIGGEFIVHGAQQEALIRAASPDFPGVKQFGQTQKLEEEWYTLKNFARDLHVILIEDNEGMKGDCYQRPPFPATWARMHHKGRVFYTSFGHRDDIWTNPDVQGIIAGGLAWAMGNVKVDVTPNIDKVTPRASQLKY
ncbi:MAG TPA: ThuA domain-containing protein [Sedimentisphaerales bacterium]|nr:ThuA domain-containing protein [Sedimentisphaerales bacterium]